MQNSNKKVIYNKGKMQRWLTKFEWHYILLKAFTFFNGGKFKNTLTKKDSRKKNKSTR